MKVCVKDVDEKDVGKRILRIDSDLIKQLNLNIDDVIKITNQKNNRTTAAKLKLGNPMDKGSKMIRIDGNLRRNLGISIDDHVEISKINAETAKEVIFTCPNPNMTIKNPNKLTNKLEGTIITKNDIFSFHYNGKIIDLFVSNYTPQSKAVTIQKGTLIIVQDVVSQECNNNNLNWLVKNLNSEINTIKSKINRINEELVFLKQKKM